MQILEEPRLIHETEDVHLLETFLFSTKMNEANFRVSQSYGHALADNAIGKDLYAIPERIFLPLSEGRGGHTSIGTKEEEYQEIRANSLGKIVSHSKPIYYEDGSGDYYYNGKVRLTGSKAASVLIENGSKTWTPFAVSSHIWPEEGNDDNITKAEFMGLGMVIKGAYGDQSVVNKYCKGSATVCNKSLAAAIQDVINNSYNTNEGSLNTMSTQQLDTSQVPVTSPLNQMKQAPLPVEETKKDITLTQEEYDRLQTQIKEQDLLKSEVSNLRNEYKTNVLNQIFNSIEDENVRLNTIDKYFKKESKDIDIVKLVKEVYEDITAQILPKKIEEAVKEAKESNKGTEVPKTSKVSSSLKPEPKKDKNEEQESLTASINDEPTISELHGIMGL